MIINKFVTSHVNAKYLMIRKVSRDLKFKFPIARLFLENNC